MLYMSSYNVIIRMSYITLSVRWTHSQKSDHVGFWRYVRTKLKESGYTNSQSQPTTNFKNTLEFATTVWIWTRVVFPHAQSLPAHQKHKSLS